MSAAGPPRLPRVALAWGALVAAWLALLGPGHRLGLWGFRPAFASMRYLVPVAVLGAVLGLVAAWRSRADRAALPRALVGVALCVLAAAYPPWLRATARSLPMIHDISTDPERAPPMPAARAARAEDDNPIEPPTPEEIQQIQEAYGDLEPLVLAQPVPKVVEATEAVLRSLGMEILEVAPDEGRVEATDTTLWWGFRDDVVVRARPDGNGATRVDVRSVSRAGRSDLGKNAARIRGVLDALRQRLGG